MFALNLDTDNRILSACVVLPSTPDTMPRVETLPDGGVTNYRYEGGEYIYDPIPVPPPTPDPAQELTLEERINDLEIAICELMDSMA